MFLVALLTMNGHHNHFNMRQIAIADCISMSNEDPSVKDFASDVPIWNSIQKLQIRDPFEQMMEMVEQNKDSINTLKEIAESLGNLVENGALKDRRDDWNWRVQSMRELLTSYLSKGNKNVQR